jgi:hypothetical protein
VEALKLKMKGTCCKIESCVMGLKTVVAGSYRMEYNLSPACQKYRPCKNAETRSFVGFMIQALEFKGRMGDAFRQSNSVLL